MQVTLKGLQFSLKRIIPATETMAVPKAAQTAYAIPTSIPDRHIPNPAKLIKERKQKVGELHEVIHSIDRCLVLP